MLFVITASEELHIRLKNKMFHDKHKIGDTMERLYRIWHNMKSRCYNKNFSRYKYYGAKNIKICDEWKNDFSKFKQWALLNGYNDNLTIDRIDINKGYEPNNCRWVDMVIQNNNTSKNHYVLYDGKLQTVANIAKKNNIHRCVLNNRLRRGWSLQEALSRKVNSYAKS